MVVGLQDRSGRQCVVVRVSLLDLGLGVGTGPIDLGGVVGVTFDWLYWEIQEAAVG